MVKVVAFSDTHGQQGKKLTKWFNENPGDILLFAGDLQLNSRDTGLGFMAWVDKLPYTHKVMIWGNHDNNHAIMQEEVGKYSNMHFLHNESITVEGINIFGSPYAPTFGHWSFMRTELELAEMYSKIPPNTDILLTHTPPHGCLDKWEGKTSVGSIALAIALDKLPHVKLSVFGHIHEGYGTLIENNTMWANASILDEHYALVNTPHVFYVETMEEKIKRITWTYDGVWRGLADK